MLSCSFLVRAPTFLQARILENVEKPIYHSQPEVTETSHNMLEGAETTGFHKAPGAVVPFCSNLSTPHQHSTENNPPTGWWFCQLCSSSGVPHEEMTGSSGSPRRSDNNWNQSN